MNTKFPVAIALFSLLVAAPAIAKFQQPTDVTARGIFLTTRNKPKANANPSAKPVHPLGLGYSLYRRDERLRPARVSEADEFRSGDALRLVIESNTDGHLYVFNTTNGREPTMIFPNLRLNNADNLVKAHAAYELPSSKEPDPLNRWFNFTGRNTMEQLYLIIARRRLPEVPPATMLRVESKGQKDWVWMPTEKIWRQIIVGYSEMLADKGIPRGKDEDYPADEIIERKIGLPPSAPEPTVMKVNKSPHAERLMIVVELKLK